MSPSSTNTSNTVPCPTCQQPVYVRANLCPHCGRRFESTKPWMSADFAYWKPDREKRFLPDRRMVRAILGFALVLLVLVALGTGVLSWVFVKAFEGIEGGSDGRRQRLERVLDGETPDGRSPKSDEDAGETEP